MKIAYFGHFYRNEPKHPASGCHAGTDHPASDDGRSKFINLKGFERNECIQKKVSRSH